MPSCFYKFVVIPDQYGHITNISIGTIHWLPPEAVRSSGESASRTSLPFAGPIVRFSAGTGLFWQVEEREGYKGEQSHDCYIKVHYK